MVSRNNKVNYSADFLFFEDTIIIIIIVIIIIIIVIIIIIILCGFPAYILSE